MRSDHDDPGQEDTEMWTANDGTTRGDELKAELNGTADRGRRITDEELEEWMNNKEAAAFRRGETGADY